MYSLMWITNVAVLLVICGLRSAETSAQYNNGSLPSVGSRSVTDYPKISCRVYNWENMTCRWNSTPNSRYDLLWSRAPSRGFFKCPNATSTSNSCSWTKSGQSLDDYLHMDVYHLALVSDDQSSTFPPPVTKIKPYHLVEPNPINTLKIELLENNSVNASWTHDTDTFVGTKILYKITYRLVQKDAQNRPEMTVSTSEYFTILRDLRAGSDYVVTVEARPVVNSIPTGFWSAPFTKSFSTKEDVPGRAPGVTAGGFYVLSSSEKDAHSVIVYWQEIPNSYANGKITETRIRYRAVSANLVSSWKAEFSTRSTSQTLHLRKDTDYQVIIDSKTSVGYNESLDLTKLFIANSDNRSNIYRNVGDFVVLVNQSLMHLHWTRPSGNISSYTVYKCAQRAEANKCAVPLEWVSISSDQNSHLIQGNSDQTFSVANILIGISVEYRTTDRVSSGILWTQCIYNMTAEMKSPNIIELIPKENEVILTWSQVHRCSLTDAYISHYIIHYWPANNQSDIQEQRFKAVITTWTIPKSQFVSAGEYTFCIMSYSPFKRSKRCSDLKNITIGDHAEKSVEGAGQDSNSPLWISSFVIAVIIVVVVFVVARFPRYREKIVNLCVGRIPISPPNILQANSQSYGTSSGGASMPLITGVYTSGDSTHLAQTSSDIASYNATAVLPSVHYSGIDSYNGVTHFITPSGNHSANSAPPLSGSRSISQAGSGAISQAESRPILQSRPRPNSRPISQPNSQSGSRLGSEFALQRRPELQPGSETELRPRSSLLTQPESDCESDIDPYTGVGVSKCKPLVDEASARELLEQNEAKRTEQNMELRELRPRSGQLTQTESDCESDIEPYTGIGESQLRPLVDEASARELLEQNEAKRTEQNMEVRESAF